MPLALMYINKKPPELPAVFYLVFYLVYGLLSWSLLLPPESLSILKG